MADRRDFVSSKPARIADCRSRPVVDDKRRAISGYSAGKIVAAGDLPVDSD